ncbi:hypothetical protein GALMADRAFT_140692 [Galerina marginata CBS 339.88]|uniref:VanZ-like domain-containing protein n=1 Tax=Galerina marginata (strain CBS 339.88) TaxID=685588 RepID=A0A067SW80_GALM3|nr:hypothetical protein GALMADRAFT_140692 [Galerina marginata CBS 339.88]
MFPSNLEDVRKIPPKLAKSIMKSHKVHIPKYDLPIRIRPWFLIFTCIIMVVLAFLGFTNFSRALPLNDKLLHFLGFFIATSVFYFIIDVEESARRIWFWRHSGFMFTTVTCFFGGGILSEFVQAALPYKVFQWGDILANLLGSTLGLCLAHYLERYYRHRKEIARLYRPLSGSVTYFEDEDEDDLEGTQLLPTHNHSMKNGGKNPRLTDVWDEREELFDIGGGSDDENDHQVGASRTMPETPRIVVSHS